MLIHNSVRRSERRPWIGRQRFVGWIVFRRGPKAKAFSVAVWRLRAPVLGRCS